MLFDSRLRENGIPVYLICVAVSSLLTMCDSCRNNKAHRAQVNPFPYLMEKFQDT